MYVRETVPTKGGGGGMGDNLRAQIMDPNREKSQVPTLWQNHDRKQTYLAVMLIIYVVKYPLPQLLSKMFRSTSGQ